MDIPKDVQTYDMPTSIIWIRDGIVYSTPKQGIVQQPNPEQMRNDMKKFREIVGNEKICMVVEVNPKSQPARKEDRDAIAAEIASFTKAMAMITPSPVTRMIVNLFFGFKPPSYPIKIFSNEKDATSWIKQFL
jgi:hypothetical protein